MGTGRPEFSESDSNDEVPGFKGTQSPQSPGILAHGSWAEWSQCEPLSWGESKELGMQELGRGTSKEQSLMRAAVPGPGSRDPG